MIRGILKGLALFCLGLGAVEVATVIYFNMIWGSGTVFYLLMESNNAPLQFIVFSNLLLHNTLFDVGLLVYGLVYLRGLKK